MNSYAFIWGVALTSLLALNGGCGGTSVEADAEAEAGSDAAAEAQTLGKVCITDPINGAGFVVDGGCELDASCAAEDGAAGVCR